MTQAEEPLPEHTHDCRICRDEERNRATEVEAACGWEPSRRTLPSHSCPLPTREFKKLSLSRAAAVKGFLGKAYALPGALRLR